jgi:hypothetical protein
MTSIEKAAQEIAAASEERRLGPKDCARCPDCMALLRGAFDEKGRLRLEFIEHADGVTASGHQEESPEDADGSPR